MYLLLDDYGYGKELFNYKDLENFAIEEIKERLYENLDIKEVVEDCVSKLENLAKTDWVNPDKYIEILECYGWKVIDMSKITSQLRTISEFYAGNNTNDVFDKVIDILSNKNKFNKEEK